MLSHVRLFVTPGTEAHLSFIILSFAVSLSLLKLISIDLMVPSNHLICCPLLLLPSVFLSIRIFSNELALCIWWPKYGSFSFSTSPSNEHSGLISFRIDWFDLLDIQGVHKSLYQHHSWRTSLLWLSDFFMVQLSHLFVTTGKTIGIPIQNFVCQVMSLFFNTLSRFVITFLPRNKHLLISWL